MTTASTLLNTAEAAQRLRASLPTLARWRGTGKGPVYIKRGGQVFYEETAINAYLTENVRQSTRDSE